MRKTKLRKAMAKGLVLVSLMAAMALPAMATTNNWSWTMNYRVVDGEANGYVYWMNAGDLSFSGEVWAYSKDPGAVSSPYQIKNRVYRQSFPSDVLECSANRTPSSTLNVKRSFSANCGFAPGDTYYIFAYTTADDGWNTKGDGSFSTN